MIKSRRNRSSHSRRKNKKREPIIGYVQSQDFAQAVIYVTRKLERLAWKNFCLQSRKIVTKPEGQLVQHPTMLQPDGSRVTVMIDQPVRVPRKWHTVIRFQEFRKHHRKFVEDTVRKLRLAKMQELAQMMTPAEEPVPQA